MTFVHTKESRVIVGQFDLTGYFNSASASFNRQNVKVTVFRQDDDVYMSGKGSGSISLGGLWDDTATIGSDVRLDAAMDGSQSVVSWSPQGATTIGQRAYLLNARQTGYPLRAPDDDAVRLNANMEADGGIRGGVVLKEYDAETSTGNLASVDNAASSAFGSVGHLHVVAFTGTDATVKITDSTDDASFADHITFTQVTGATSERASATGTVNRYARVELTGTFTTITFAVTFARHNL